MLAVNTMKGSSVIAKMAGMESTAKITSVEHDANYAFALAASAIIFMRARLFNCCR